ncbi:MAG: zinc metalloprotease HtpX [Nitrososphaerota archaeon]|nr:zinc metalloprotease HtpX [Nitrososphaerota archaeon]
MPATVGISLLKLRLAMAGVWFAVFGAAALVLTAIVLYLGLSVVYVYGVIVFVLVLNLIQWLFGPYLINAIYHARPADSVSEAWLYESVRSLAQKSGLSREPKVMIAEIDLPNAFAYGSPLTGPMVAVTRGILRRMPRDEIESVLAHEVGHLRHRDVVVMLMISLLPAIIYYIGYSLYMSGVFGGGRRNGSAYALLVGLALMVLSFVFNIFVFLMSRLREYYADSHAALVVPDGARKLQRALVRIMALTGRVRPEERVRTESLKMFFISDPETFIDPDVNIDAVIERLRRTKPNALADLFSTHPHPAKRIQNLDRFVYAY